MDAHFWHERWKAGEIGFHRQEIHVYLQEFWPRLELEGTERILVPLCGKSNDMLWLLEQGHRVLGVEISPLAVAAFFQENRLEAAVTQKGAFTSWAFAEIEILCGDFFDLRAQDLAGVGAVYDRASLIALPPPMRQRYASHLAGLLAPATRCLLVTLEYPQAEMPGPPFSVEESEVRELYGRDFNLCLLREKDVLAEEPRFQARGIRRLHERAYRLDRLPPLKP